MEVSALTHASTAPGLRGPSPLLRLQSDERLLALTRRGQHAAFETLCARYQSRLLSFCRHMLASREDAEDVLQEVFAAAFHAVLADERAINVRPWLYRIARNRSLNHLRRASAIGVDSMDVHFADHGISTSDRVLRRESFRELIADVHDLPETQRTALLLREIDALSYEQIAQAMETTIPSVKSLLVRARISLAEAAEARKLTCEQVRLELGEMSEGLTKLSTPARRHVRGCQRCSFFRKQLKRNNHALAAILPVGPLLLLKNLLLTKIGSAGGAHVAGGAGATVGAGATAGAVAGVGATAGSGVAGGLLTAGAGAVATKAVAGLAAAAVVTAGAVAADRAVVVQPHHHRASASSYASSQAARRYATEPVIVRERAQPASAASVHKAAAMHPAAQAPTNPPATTDSTAAPAPATPTPSAVPIAPPAKPTDPSAQPTTQVTEVTSETTELPASSTNTPQPTTPSTSPPPPQPLPTAEPVPVPEPPPPAPSPAPAASQSATGQPPPSSAGGTEAPEAAAG